ncbi:EAL domain-containing protein [Neptunomonas antarctica]|uniref:Diguanylate cyclase/phosphodiesterase n=1 Tax=Neptunomonas antarctica TaxID=619304 RepID=A0A1N7KKD8_9GAMM|nr:EAL domain-containing protein [Neptunomonas antarctica]SIS61890.1 diguanylate cyclase/phosphodiesterase [Neptunomonas antarctica]
MSLLNQLTAAVFAVLIGLVSGTLYIMSDSSKEMLLHQLESHGQDTATHLGLYLAPYMADEDTAMIETTVNAIFDSGFYHKIEVTNADQKTLFSSTTPVIISEKVPQWFLKLVQITPPSMEREISHQWRKVGKIKVQSRAGYAYEQLWKGAEKTLIWFISLALIAVLSLSYLLRLILRPLKGVEEQATALSERKYVEQKQIPKTRELKNVVEAMNRMVRRVHLMFDEQSRHIDDLRKTAYQDNLTGLANQRSTQAQLCDWLDYRKEFGPGTCIYLHIPNLQALNEKFGEEKANNFLRYTAKQLENLSIRYQPNIVGRLSGADFIALIPETDEETIKCEITKLNHTIKTRADFENISPDQPAVHISVTQSTDDTSAAQLLSEARILVRQAAIEKTDIQFPEQFTGTQVASSSWQEHVANAINNKQVFLQFQKVLSSTEKKPLQRELLVRILNRENIPCTANEFIHVVKELGLIEALDKAVLERAIEYISHNPTSSPLTVNLTQQTIHTENFDKWLRRKLGKHPLKGKLNIEINETAVLNDVEHIVRFRDLLRKNSIGFGVDNFGIHPSGFSYIYAVQPDYIKIDGSLIREVDHSAEDRFFISSLITAVHSLGIEVYAERVEKQSQVEQLILLNIDGTQGFLHGRPEALV